MSGPAFFQTRMGQIFYEVTMRGIGDELKRLNTNLEALVVELRKSNQHPGETAGCDPSTPAVPSPGDRTG